MSIQDKASLSPSDIRRKRRQRIFEMVLFAMLGALMFASKLAMEILPNIHLVGMFTILFTALFRVKALIPIYIFVFISGIYMGFSTWWIPYLYIWIVLWGMAMLIPKRTTPAICVVLYPVLCALHGFLFGTLYAPVYALIMNFSFKEMLSWIVVGLSFDAVHGISNLALGTLVMPLSTLMKRLLKGRYSF